MASAVRGRLTWIKATASSLEETFLRLRTVFTGALEQLGWTEGKGIAFENSYAGDRSTAFPTTKTMEGLTVQMRRF